MVLSNYKPLPVRSIPQDPRNMMPCGVSVSLALIEFSTSCFQDAFQIWERTLHTNRKSLRLCEILKWCMSCLMMKYPIGVAHVEVIYIKKKILSCIFDWSLWRPGCKWQLMNYFSTHLHRLRQNGRHFLDDIFKGIFLNENFWILNEIWLKYVSLWSNW